MPRLLVESLTLGVGVLELPAAAARHLRVLRLRDGDALTLFDGRGGEWRAVLVSGARVEVLEHLAVERELEPEVTLALVMPANDRMDAVVEKATELGAAALQPLTSARSVLRLDGERAARRVQHWRGVAAAACEQCGRNRLPEVEAPRALTSWLAALPPADAQELRLLLAAPSQGQATTLATLSAGLGDCRRVLALSGPEGGFDDGEIAAALRAGFIPLRLGERVLRADTAPLALLAGLQALL